MKNNIVFVVLFPLLLAACATEYTFTPPPDKKGKACTQQCQARQSNCRLNTQTQSNKAQQQCQQNADTEYAQCEHDALLEYNACLRYATLGVPCIQSGCTKKPCFESSDFSFCDSEFRSCYQQCGGSVGVMQ